MRKATDSVREWPRILIPTPTSIDLEYNRQCWPQYAAAVSEAGGHAVQADLVLGAKGLRELALTCSGVLLPGSLADVSPELYGHARDAMCGPRDQAREQCDWALLEHVFATGMPLLAICYGMQSLNVFRGGTLVQDIDVISVRHTAGASVGVAHAASVATNSCLAGLLDDAEGQDRRGSTLRFGINSSHHQAVGIVGDGLRVVARSAEDGVVESVELAAENEAFLLGVQWHPERTIAISATSRAIFRELVRGAGVFANFRRTADAGR